MISLTMSREDWRTGSIPELPLLRKQKFKIKKGKKVKEKEHIDHALSSSLLSIILWCAWLSWQFKILLFISLVITIFSIIYLCGVAVAKKKKIFKK